MKITTHEPCWCDDHAQHEPIVDIIFCADSFQALISLNLQELQELSEVCKFQIKALEKVIKEQKFIE